MQEVERHHICEYEFQQSIRDDMKANHDFGANGRAAPREQADNDDGNNRNVIEAGKAPNDLPQAFRCEPKHWRDQERE